MPDEIRAELARIFESTAFKATLRRRKMLRFLIEEMLAGRGDQLKGYTIGVKVFDRGKSFDPQADPVVRLEARRLRSDLDSYYVSGGRGNPLRISIPKGQYIPHICWSEPDMHPPDGASSKPAESPVSVGTLTADATKPEKAIATLERRLHRWITGAALAGIVMVAALGYVLVNHWRQGNDGEMFAHGPALMILPFEVLGNNSKGSVLAVGIADQIMAELNRFPDLRLYMPPSDFGQYSAAAAVEAGERMSYVLDGRVSLDGSAVSIGARLVDVLTGRILWADEFERKLTPNSLLAVRGEIAAAIASALGQPYGVIRTELTRRLTGEFAPSMSSYECVLRAYSYRRTFADELHAPIIACLKAAVRRDPGYAEAWAMLGWLYLDAGRFDRVPDGDREHAYDQALDAASHAVLLDGKDVLALKALSSINHYLGNYEESERIQREALALNPNDPDTLAQLGWRLAVRGRFDEGIPYLERAIERSVNPPGWYYHLIAVDHYMHGRYAEMLTAAKRGAASGSDISWSFVAIAHGALGNAAAARQALEKMAELSPLLARDPAALYRRHQAADGIVDALVAGLRKAGWSEPGIQQESAL